MLFYNLSLYLALNPVISQKYTIDKKKISGFCPVVKNLPCNAENINSIPGPGRSHMPWGN